MLIKILFDEKQSYKLIASFDLVQILVYTFSGLVFSHRGLLLLVRPCWPEFQVTSLVSCAGSGR